MPDFSLCMGRAAADQRAPLKLCAECGRRTVPPGHMQSYIVPPARRVAGREVWVCEMRVERPAGKV